MRRADRSIRVLLVSSTLKDRSLVREGLAETSALFDGLRITAGEKAFLQSYHPEEGWKTVKAKVA